MGTVDTSDYNTDDEQRRDGKSKSTKKARATPSRKGVSKERYGKRGKGTVIGIQGAESP